MRRLRSALPLLWNSCNRARAHAACSEEAVARAVAAINARINALLYEHATTA